MNVHRPRPTAQHPHEELLSRLELIEEQRRALDAARLRLIATAIEQVTAMPAVVEQPSSGAAREHAYRSLRAELALALNLSEHQIEQQMNLATTLVDYYPGTLDALERGAIAYEHARVVIGAGTVIGADHTAEATARRVVYEAAVLEHASRQTPNRLRPIARRLAEQCAEQSIDERYERALRRRRVCVIDRDDGMAELYAYLPAVEAYAIHDRLTRISQAAERGERVVRGVNPINGESGDSDGSDGSGDSDGSNDDCHGDGRQDGGSHGGGSNARPRTFKNAGQSRSRDELRADVFAELLLASDERTLFAGSSTDAIQGRVQVQVCASAIKASSTSGASSASNPSMRPGTTPSETAEHERHAGYPGYAGYPGHAETTIDPHSFEACELVGHGPLPATLTRLIAASAPVWDRVTSEESTGEVLRVDRYRPSEQMRRLLAARDQHCRFPGCCMPIHRCDLDHTIDAARGEPTSTDNLAHLCRGHHTLKHHSEWRVTQERAGVLRWVSPAGRRYTERPPGRAGSLPSAKPPREPSAIRFAPF